MEDTIIKPGTFAYQFRVDVEDNCDLTQMMTFMQKYDVKHYIVGAETSTSGKQHFQCILWFDTKINTTKLRNWWKGKTSSTNQPVSMTSAKKIRSLGKYASKDKNFITNLSKEEMSKIGQWSPKKKADEWNKLLDVHAKKFDASNVETYHQVSYDTHAWNPKAVMHAFMDYMLDYYKANNKRPHRATLQYIAWKHGHMSNKFLISSWF